MQRDRGALDSFPEPIDLNQGSIPNSTAMDHPSSWDNMISPVDSQLSNYMIEPTAPNVGCTNFSGWDHGESSSSMNNSHDRNESKSSLRWSNLFESCPLPDPTSENWSFGPPQPSVGTSSSRPASMLNYNSAHATRDLNSCDGYARELHGFNKSGCSEIDQNPTFYASSSDLGAFAGSSNASVSNSEISGSSFGTWGSSCKRKAVEGTSGQFYPPIGTPGSIDQQHSFPGSNPSRGNLRLDLSPANYQEQVNSSNGVRISSQSSFCPSSRGGSTNNPARNFPSRTNHGRRDPILLNNSRITTSRNLGAYSSESRSPVTITMSPNGPLSQSRSPYPDETDRGGGHHYPPWNGPSGLQGSNFSGSAARPREEIRTYRRNNSESSNNSNLEYPLNISASQDQIDWTFVPRNLLSSRNHSPGSRAGPVSGSNRAHPSPPTQNYQRWPETATWASFHRDESDSGIRRGHFGPHLTSPLDEAGPSSRSENQLRQRSPVFLMDVTGEEVSGWRSLAAIESRHRLIRQVLSAMRRGVHLQAEDYMLVDPLISGFAELHDRHRDMRLDVDNMSYEELLALEERIGNVSTGLSEEQVTGAMKQRKFGSLGVLPNLEPCCVCQEVYITGDNIGILDCGHEFHAACIKRWLTLKNLCPICKMTALGI